MRVLIAEDDPLSRRILETMLGRWGYQAETASDGLMAWEVLRQEDAPRLAILDWMMPGMSGVEVCRAVRDRGDKQYTYVILLTARGRQEDIVEGMDAGADDYITKPFDSGELRVRLNAARRVLTLQAELLAAREVAEQRATHDSLTGLWNRSAILDMLGDELARARREGRSVGVALADLDYFKHVNDTHGHRAGDEVLAETARRMHAIIRPYDRIGRYGGEEFLIVLPGCTVETGRKVAERIRQGIACAGVTTTSNTTIALTVSLGVAIAEIEGQAEADIIVHRADQALYTAKRAGRNRVEVADASLVADNV